MIVACFLIILSLLCDCGLFPQLLSIINSDVRSQFSMVTALFMISFELLPWERCPHFLHFSNASKHCQQFLILPTFVLTLIIFALVFLFYAKEQDVDIGYYYLYF